MKSSLPVKERAGTVLDHRFCVHIRTSRTGDAAVGTLDYSQQVYQWGGILQHMVYWKEQCIVLGLDEWKQVQQRANTLELIDFQKNECWRTDIWSAIRFGRELRTPNGTRWGIPVEAWDILTADGTVRKERTLRRTTIAEAA